MTASRVSTVIRDAASVDAAIESRLSTRAFLPQAVPRETIADILRLASRAPSGTNTQPWKVHVLQGRTRDRLVQLACEAEDSAHANPAMAFERQEGSSYYPEKWVSPYIDRRRENGWGLYGLLGIVKGDKARMHAQHWRNFELFGAPVALMFTMDKVLGRGSLLDYGMFLQNIMVAARARGLHTCPQAAWLKYERIVMPLIGAGESEQLVCGMSLGYADEGESVNSFHTPRVAVEEFTLWHD